MGNGEECRVLAQPWFDGAMSCQPEDRRERNCPLVELVQEGSGLWDVERLIHFFGISPCLNILSSVMPPSPAKGQDKLIFKLAQNGDFSVNKAYKALTAPQVPLDQQTKRVWEVIWKKGQVAPRIRLFFWKLINNALPLSSILAHRMRRGDPTCLICGQHDESVTHMLLTCPFARSCWMSSPVPLRTENLNMPVKELILMLDKLLSDEQWTACTNVAWAIWRCRNDHAYSGSRPTRGKFISYLAKIQSETGLAATATRSKEGMGEVCNTEEAIRCYVDGSWSDSWQAGAGFVFQKEGALIAYGMFQAVAYSPFQIEAMGLLRALRYAIQEGIQNCVFFSDCSRLVDLVMQQTPPIQTDWTAAQEVLEIWQIMKGDPSLQCVHVSRSHNELADQLARIAREKRIDILGYTFPIFPNV